jgi:threonine synthase
MARLRDNGKYAVSQDVFSAIKQDFSAGFCTDDETKAAIRAMFEDKGYLMDTHTAVAYKVLSDYRRDTGDKRAAVVVSTASPFKFAADVLDALGVKNAAEPLSALSEKSGMPVPAPLSGLDKRPVRFTKCAARDALMAQVDEFLGK